MSIAPREDEDKEGRLTNSLTTNSVGRKSLVLAAALLPIVFLWGCAGSVGGTSTPKTSAAQTYSISGTITPAAGGSGATVTLSGAASSTTTANSTGGYSFTGLANGTYAITPRLTGYAFNPSAQSVTVSGANVTGIDFTATAQQVHSVALSWKASTSSVTGYNVFRSTLSGTGYGKINSSLVVGLAYTDSTVQSGTTYYYVTTAVDAGGIESAFSNQASAVIP
jgi:hypothetical protein